MSDMFTQYDPDLRKVLKQFKKGSIDESTAMISFRFIVDMHARKAVEEERAHIFEKAGERALNLSMELYGEANGGINMAANFKNYLFKQYTEKPNEQIS